MSRILIKNIKQLIQVRDNAPLTVKGSDMAKLPVLENAWLLIEDHLISDYGLMPNMSLDEHEATQVIDATGRLVMPTWCDSHTHIVYASCRQLEFVDRIKGLTYEQIAENGGGILNSAKKLKNTSEDDLYGSAQARLDEIISMGTGAVEIKSGYGLNTESELKMLRVIKRLKQSNSIPIKATFLGAHAFPTEFKNNRSAYVDQIINEMLPQIAEQKLADYIDVFCDRGFFNPEETDRILKAGEKYGLKSKIHANELDFSQGIQVGVSNKALSVDHLEFTGDKEIEALLNSNTMPTLLPSTAFFLKLHYPPARKMIDAGLPVALSSDYNPGSSPSGNMSFVLSLACIHLNMLPEEAINAATVNSAYAMELSETHGTITRGKKANFFITKQIDNYQFIPYSFGSSVIERVFIGGKEI